MKTFSFLIFLLNSLDLVAGTNCHLPMFSLTPVISTPLQIEAEEVLRIRGYLVDRKTIEEFTVANLQDAKMFATVKVGHAHLGSNQDCISRNFEELGIFYTCHFDLRLFIYSPEGSEFVEAVQVKAATKDARTPDRFYSSVRSQLSAFPTCIEFLIKR